MQYFTLLLLILTLILCSLSLHYAPLESVIRDALSDKQPELYNWFWSKQVPSVVSRFVNYFKKDQRFAAVTRV